MITINSYFGNLNDFAIKSKSTIIECFKIIHKLDELEKIVENKDNLSGIDCRSVYVKYYENWLFTVKTHSKINNVLEEIIKDVNYDITAIDFYNVNLIIKVDLLLFLDHVVSIVYAYENLHTVLKDSEFNIIDDINNNLNSKFNSLGDIKNLIKNLLKVYMSDDYKDILN